MSDNFLIVGIDRFFQATSRPWRALRIGLLCMVVGTASGCTSVSYYAQAVRGHIALMTAARPIDDWLADPGTTPQLRQRLELARRIRAYASRELGLPDNRSYTRYADLGRPAVVWNVFATPELSLTLKRWCYPMFGCAGYRGYFAQADAQALAAELRAAGNDVEVGQVPAYSTLGWFPDPLLSTFINWPDGELARLIFHELAHQVLYVDDDTVFNESFATAVERIGVRRWLADEGTEAARASYPLTEKRRAQFLALLLEYRERLATVYAGGGTEDERRAGKQQVLEALRQEHQRLKQAQWQGFSGYDTFFGPELNGARLGAIGAYNDLVPAFEQVLASVDGDLRRYFEAVRRIAALPRAQRDAALGRTTRIAP